MIYGDYEINIISKAKYERLCEELSESEETNKQLEMEKISLQLENERLLAIISNFNKALEILGGVK